MGGDWVAPGDLVVVTVTDAAGAHWLLASFHGDSAGLSTQPVRLASAALPRVCARVGWLGL